MASKFWNILKPTLDAIVFSNTWISLAALSLYLGLKLTLGLSPLFFEGVLVFSASFIAYNYLKLKGLNLEGNESVFNQWLKQYRNIVYALIVVVGFGFVYSISKISIGQLIVLAIAGLLSLIYIGVERYNLRSFWFLKTQIVAFVWAWFIMGIALVDVFTEIHFALLAVLFAGVFFFILGLTIPFDIRDWKADQHDDKMTTLPMVFGIKGTLVIALLHLLLSFICLFIYSYYAIILLPIFVIGGRRIYQLNSDSSEYAYTFFLDGLIVMVYPILWIAGFLYNL